MGDFADSKPATRSARKPHLEIAASGRHGESIRKKILLTHSRIQLASMTVSRGEKKCDAVLQRRPPRIRAVSRMAGEHTGNPAKRLTARLTNRSRFPDSGASAVSSGACDSHNGDMAKTTKTPDSSSPGGQAPAASMPRRRRPLPEAEVKAASKSSPKTQAEKAAKFQQLRADAMKRWRARQD